MRSSNPLHTLQINLLTPWCRVLLEQLTGLQLVKKFPPFHGTRRFITALTSVRHLSLSWASPIHSIYPHPTSCRSILILSTHLRLGLHSGLLPSGFPTKKLYTPLSSPIGATYLLTYFLTYLLTYLITYLLTYSTVQSHFWAANWFAASLEIPPPPFTEPEGSLSHSQASATCLYPGPAQSSPYTHIPPPADPS